MSIRSLKHRARKRFGQNFLRDPSIIDGLERAINPQATDRIVEIGPGLGALTRVLLDTGCRLDAIELDRDLTTPLLAAFSVYPGFTLHSADALGFDYARLAVGGKRLRIVGNLPYNISTPLIFSLLETAGIVEDMHFMLQLEVVQRLTAEPGDRHWGRLGVMTQLSCRTEMLFEVPPEAFDPQPKVQSAIVRLTPLAVPRVPLSERQQFERVVTTAFSQRRKTLRNALKPLLSSDVITAAGIDPGRRAETLSIDEFISLTAELP
ncbi:MAG: 16S rRNA (adenine(1518)-N(6)/adenine(1519)-N(6))-dimethyltransferase RsmA [Pseudomonadota bacterium]